MLVVVNCPFAALKLNALLQLAVVEYDPTSHDLKTVSMHYFENDDLKVRCFLCCNLYSKASTP